MRRPQAAIKAIASYLPLAELTNEQLAKEWDGWDAGKIMDKTGIAVRYLAGPDECASDLGVAAAQRLFRTGACAPQEIDFLLFCTQSPDYFLPTTACLVQDRLGLSTRCGALDINQGCSGFVYGLALAKSLIETGTAANVLLITADTYSKFLHPKDRSARVLFGDGAAATWLGPVEVEGELLGPFVFGTDGRGAPHLIVTAGGLRHRFPPVAPPPSAEAAGPGCSERHLRMNGPAVFTFTLEAVPRAVNELLRKTGRRLEDVDYFVFHQANRFMLERLQAKLGIPEGKFWLDLERGGNTVSSTIPMALERARAQQALRPGDDVMVVGFGVGYSWAATMLKIL